jgi:hypothetical protein
MNKKFSLDASREGSFFVIGAIKVTTSSPLERCFSSLQM